jgi:hypothetical protein
MVPAVRDAIAKRGLRAIAAAVIVLAIAQRATVDCHGPIATAGGPDD